MKIQKIVENQKQNLRDLLEYIASGEPIDQKARKVLRRMAVGTVRQLDGCLLAQDREPTITDGLNYHKIYPYPTEELPKDHAMFFEEDTPRVEGEDLPW